MSEDILHRNCRKNDKSSIHAINIKLSIEYDKKYMHTHFK